MKPGCSYGVLSLASLVACGGGERPGLEECFVGEFFADCGGTESEPVLACDHDGYDCRWFAGGRIAEGYVASDCPSDGVCCHDSWPFADWWPIALSVRLYGLGVYPWSRARDLSVAVVVDPEIVAGEPVFTCAG